MGRRIVQRLRASANSSGKGRHSPVRAPGVAIILEVIRGDRITGRLPRLGPVAESVKKSGRPQAGEQQADRLVGPGPMRRKE